MSHHSVITFGPFHFPCFGNGSLVNQLTYEESYKDNLPHGQFKWWYSNGQIESIKYFDNGKPVGTWEFYDSKGALIKKLDYGIERNGH